MVSLLSRIPLFADRKVRLRTTLFVPFVLQITGAVALVGWLSLRSGTAAVNDLAQQLQTRLTQHVTDQVSTYIANPHRINQMNLYALERGLLDWQQPDAAKTYLWQQALIEESVGYVGFASAEGQYLRVGWINRLAEDRNLEIAFQSEVGGGTLSYYRLNSAAPPQLDDWGALGTQVFEYDVRVRPFYTVAETLNRAAWSEIYVNVIYPILQINASQPYYGPNGEFAGIVTCQLGLEQIGQFLQSLEGLKNGQIYIIERSGNLVASSLKEVQLLEFDQFGQFRQENVPNRDKMQAENSNISVKFNRIPATKSQGKLIQASAQFLQETFGDFQAITTEQQLDFQLDGERQYLQVSPFRDSYGLDWLIVVAVPESDFMAEIDRNRQVTLMLCLLTFATVVNTCFITSRWITRPIRRLSDVVVDFARGDFSKRGTSSIILEVDRLSTSFNTMADELQELIEDLDQRVKERTAELSKEQERSETLLLNILPQKLVEQLKDSSEVPAEFFPQATVLFADLVGFTQLAKELEARQLVGTLNAVFSAFDRFTEQYGLEKIKTIGDAYMVAGGLPEPTPNHAAAIAEMALAICDYMAEFPVATDHPLQVRIGINSGPVLAGVIGQKKFIYDLWGDAVNVAARMESHGEAGKIQVTASTYGLLKDAYVLEERGVVNIKGCGEMTTYWLIGKKSPEG